MRRLFRLLLICFITYMLLVTVAEMPTYGAADNPTNNYVTRYYLEHGLEATGAVNVIAQIILDFRAYDTLIETTVLFTAMAGVITTLKSTWTWQQSKLRDKRVSPSRSRSRGTSGGLTNG